MKKIKIFLKIIIITILVFIVVFSSKSRTSNASFTIGSYTIDHIDDFKRYIRENTSTFINANDSTYYGETFKSDSSGGVSYLTEDYRYVTCLCHPINSPNGEVYREVSDVFTIEYGSNGYTITQNGRTLSQAGLNSAGKGNIPKLAYLIEYQSTVPSDGKNMNYTAPGNVALAETFYDMRVKRNSVYANYANDNRRGIAFINVSQPEFFQSDTGHYYMTHDDSEDFDGAANKRKAKQLMSEAENYATEVASYESIKKISTYFDAEKQDSDYIIGPLEVQYGGKGINSVEVKVGRVKEKADISWSYNGYSNWNNSVSSIPSNEKFYLKISNSDSLVNKDVSVNIIQDSMMLYKAKLLLCAGIGTVNSNGDVRKSSGLVGQQAGVFAGESYSSSSKVEYKFRIENNLVITKKDQDTRENLNAGFKVKTSEGWLKGDGSYTYSNSEERADVYNTLRGSKTLSGLKDGTYEVYEVEPPSTYDLTKQIGYENGKVKVGTKQLSTGETITFNTTNRKFGNLRINMADEYSGEGLRAGFKIKTSDGWLSGSKGSYKYNNSTMNRGDTYYTNSGSITLEELKLSSYEVYEVEAPTSPKIYILSRQDGYSNSSVKIGNSQTLTDGATIIFNGTNKRYGDITINKEDQYTKEKLKAGFAIYSYVDKGYVQGTNGNYTYKNTLDEARRNPYYTDAVTGATTIKDLKAGSYRLVEVVAPEDYYLTAQENYDATNNYVLIENNFDLEDAQNKIFNTTNRKLIDISGYVWIDKPDGKQNIANNKYDNGEEKPKGVIVTLRNKSDGSLVKGYTDESNNTANTGDDGAYKFNKVNVNFLKDYYIEFDYSKTQYKQYVPVQLNEGTDVNTSKALIYDDVKDDILPVTDGNFIGKATTYRQRPQSNEDNYGLSHFFKTELYTPNNNTMNGINLGLKQLKDPEFRIEQDIAYVKVHFDNSKYKYIYGGMGNVTLADTPLVNMGTSTNSYTRDIYPSDVLANKASMDANKGERLKVYVVYRIFIKNTSLYNVPDIYVEDKLNITGLTEKIDSKYELNTTDIDPTFDAGASEDFNKWQSPSISEEGTTTKYIGDTFNDGLGPGETKSVYIQFKVSGTEINKILSGNVNATEVIAKTTAYHDYKRNDYAWFANTLSKLNQSHRTPAKLGQARAPGMIFKLPDNKERTITGTVFKDEATQESKNKNEVVGNGIKDESEKNIKDVTVQLYTQKDGNLEVATRYTKNEPLGTQNPQKTTEEGNYSFDGVLPGDYVVRFTYGDGTIYDVKENKSTIITLESAKNALGNGENKHGKEWYKYLNGNNTEIDNKLYSTAVDNLEQRKKINYDTTGNLKTIEADTPVSYITIENTTQNQAQAIEITKSEEKDTIQYEENKETTIIKDINKTIANKDEVKEIFKGFNLGIIELPERTSELKKIITNVKLTNAQQNVIFNGNPEKVTDMLGVSDLDSTENGGSTFTRIELADSYIYASTIEIEYGIEIRNTSKDTYTETDKAHEGMYYIYGEIDPNYSKKVETDVKEMIDYCDPTTIYVKDDKVETKTIEAEITEITKIGAVWKDPITHKEYTRINEGIIESQKARGEPFKKLLAVLNLNNIATGRGKDFTMSVTRVLATDDADMDVLNTIEITVIKNSIEGKNSDEIVGTDVEETIKLVRQPTIPQPARARVTVTPPTGENKQVHTKYVEAGIFALIILATGVVIIKQKVL